MQQQPPKNNIQEKIEKKRVYSFLYKEKIFKKNSVATKKNNSKLEK